MYTRFKYTLFSKRRIIMKIAFVVSENLRIYAEDIEFFTEAHDSIVINRANSLDDRSAKYLKAVGYEINEFSPDFERYGEAAPEKIVDDADKIILFHYGSPEVKRIAEYAREKNKPHEMILRPLIIKLH